MSNHVACIVCLKDDVPVNIHPHAVDGKIVGLMYCCDGCRNELLKIKITKEK